MTEGGLIRSRAGVVGEWALWTSAAFLVFAAHAGAVAFLMREPAMEAADSGSPPAIMIELAPVPEAINTEETDIAPDTFDAEEVQTASVEPQPLPPEPEELPLPEPIEPVAEPIVEPEVAEVPPEPIIEPEPTPEPQPEPVDPIEQMVMAALENVEVPIPTARPTPPKPTVEKKPEPKKVERQQRPKRAEAPASQAARQAKAEVTQSNRNAASANAAGASSNVSPARWQSRLMSHLERRKRYPSAARANREEGTVYVRFRIDDSGNVLSVSLSRSSGYPTLDNAVLDMVRRASPVPAPPPGANKTITAPVRFNIR